MMDFASVLSKSDPHQRTIIHLDMDCFYAQVEEIRDPSLRTQPLGIQQKNFVVTCNYVAREYGVTKLMCVADAKHLCPQLVLVNGEDLLPYKHMSQRIHDILLNYTPAVEKLGLDENFLDVSALVATRHEHMQMDGRTSPTTTTMLTGNGDPLEVVGHIWPADGTRLDACECGCAARLAIGSRLAQEIRRELHSQLGITCCAGISYNKLLAKLAGAQNKPNQQTVLVSTHSEEFMRHLRGLNRITGIGQKTESLLLESGIANVAELQGCEMDWLRKKCGFETATKLRDLAFGRDGSAVRATGRPKTIGLEDSCRPISVRNDVEDRFRMLLMRLMEQVGEDGRIPIAVKVILRKFDTAKKTSHRETKQANILPSLFRTTATTTTAAMSGNESGAGSAKVVLADGAQDKLLKIVMRLFERVVDLAKPFNITLIGLAFSKFQQRKVGSSSIANFLIKKTDLEVQSITSLTNTSMPSGAESAATAGATSAAGGGGGSDEAFRSSPTTFQPSDQFYRRRTTAASPIPMLVDNGSESAATNSDFSDFSETEVEPSPKKSRIGRMLMAKRRCLGNSSLYTANDVAGDVASPSKLRVCDLRLNSRDSEKDFAFLGGNSGGSGSNSSSSNCSNNNNNNNGSGTTTTNTANGGSITVANASPSSAFAVAALRFRSVKPPSTLLSRLATNGGGAGGGGGLAISTLARQSYSANSSPLPSPMDDSSEASSLAATPTGEVAPAMPMCDDSCPPSPAAGAAAAAPAAVPSIRADALLAIAVSATTAVAEPSEMTTTATATATITGHNVSSIPYPKSVDPQVFNELPLDVQNELIESWRNSLAAAVAASSAAAASNGPLPPSAAKSQSAVGGTAKAGGAAGGAAQKNTLYRYFLRNK